jgi:DNA invertase Pin-like site-specific DNA recombinase
LIIDEFIEAEVSSREDTGARRIDELQDKLQKGDTLLVAELSCLGREMLQVLNIINDLSEKGVKLGRPKGSRNKKRCLILTL